MSQTINYRCTQAELYAVCDLAWKNCKNHQADFSVYKPLYTLVFINARILEVNNAQKLPDEQTRNDVSETLRIALAKKARTCLNRWQDLKRYIATAFAEDLQDTKLQAAGADFYDKASHKNWEVLKNMLVTAEQFITNNSAQLLAANNMPAGFPAVFTAAKNAFDLGYTNFLLAEENEPIQSDAKITANNTIYDKTITMCLDGQRIYIAQPEVKKQFVWDEMLALVTAPGPAGLKGTVANAADNAPVESAALTLVELDKTVLSDVNGEYDFGNIPSGIYQLKIVKVGFQDLITSVQVLTGTASTKDFALIPL